MKCKYCNVWHIDETIIKVKGNNCYNWVIIDSNSKFIVSSNLTFTRTKEECDEIFKMSKEVTKEYPRFIFSDGYSSYKTCVWNNFNDRRVIRKLDNGIEVEEPYTKHIKVIKITDEHFNNNLIERQMGYIKSFYKTRRAFKNLENANIILQGLSTYYNFLRPHESLNYKTPAKVIGCDLDTSKRWLSLIS